ncbi:histidine phosphotransferase ChpT [Salinihabitans flavidus]|uniref:Histidine phosphotransferase ChpT n=1 Tax=Salinihabitans flavidus TaxID=569882 RepID=A0A1H8VAY6_9RHOB|nr:histidine phosphotransferase family protein [Salinihabitans flavidus]SEP12471.1 histidine phosphotransferase ChpT [Salinihabitans flavidus]
MDQPKVKLAALVGSRICHDLVSPVGAIGNGLELLEMSGGAAGPELDLIRESVENANARIRFFRVAFGHAGLTELVGEPEVRAMLRDMGNGGRVQYDWHPAGDILRMELCPIFLAIMCVESALPYGGAISVHHTHGKWEVEGAHEKLRVEDTLWSDLERGKVADTITPARVQFALLPESVANLRRKLTIELAENRVTLGF